MAPLRASSRRKQHASRFCETNPTQTLLDITRKQVTTKREAKNKATARLPVRILAGCGGVCPCGLAAGPQCVAGIEKITFTYFRRTCSRVVHCRYGRLTDDPAPPGADAQPQGDRPRPAPGAADRRDGRQRGGEELAGVRHALCRGAAAVRRDVLGLCPAVPRAAREARRRPDREHPAGHRRRRARVARPRAGARSGRSPRSTITSACSMRGSGEVSA